MILATPPDDTHLEPSIQIVGQFDGSCLREETLGGAGYVIYAIESGRSRVIACRSVALPLFFLECGRCRANGSVLT